MTVNERLERLERSAGKGDHDLLLKLDAMSRQIQHQETLLKAFEDANQERFKVLDTQQYQIVQMACALPLKFMGRWVRVGWSLRLVIEPEHEPNRRLKLPKLQEVAADEPELRHAFVYRPSAVHEKPHP